MLDIHHTCFQRALVAYFTNKIGVIHAPYHYKLMPIKIQGEVIKIMIKYDRLWNTLKEKNISQYKLIKDYGIDKAQLHRLRKNMIVKTLVLNNLCRILDCRIEEIMEYVPDEDE